MLGSCDFTTYSAESRDRIKLLEEQVSSLGIMPAAVDADPDNLSEEVYQLATRIYLFRASQNAWSSSTGLGPLVDRAFTQPLTSCTCTHFFPIFIIGCEATTDERRAAVLSLLGRAETDASARKMDWLKNVIQSVWVQQDLHADSDLLLDYLGLMSAVISSSETLPSFV